MRIPTLALLAIMTPAALGQEAVEEVASVDATLKRMQQMLHHAVEMAAEGAQLVALAETAEPSSIDGLVVERGRRILADARALITQVAAGDAMMQLHAIELTDAQSATMIRTHQLEQVATSYLDVTAQLLPGSEAESGDDASASR